MGKSLAEWEKKHLEGVGVRVVWGVWGWGWEVWAFHFQEKRWSLKEEDRESGIKREMKIESDQRRYIYRFLWPLSNIQNRDHTDSCAFELCRKKQKEKKRMKVFYFFSGLSFLNLFFSRFLFSWFSIFRILFFRIFSFPDFYFPGSLIYSIISLKLWTWLLSRDTTTDKINRTLYFWCNFW
jgi:hypothetical protein